MLTGPLSLGFPLAHLRDIVVREGRWKGTAVWILLAREEGPPPDVRRRRLTDRAMVDDPRVLEFVRAGEHDGTPFLAVQANYGLRIDSWGRALAHHGKLASPELARHVVAQAAQAIEAVLEQTTHLPAAVVRDLSVDTEGRLFIGSLGELSMDTDGRDPAVHVDYLVQLLHDLSGGVLPEGLQADLDALPSGDLSALIGLLQALPPMPDADLRARVEELEEAVERHRYATPKRPAEVEPSASTVEEVEPTPPLEPEETPSSPPRTEETDEPPTDAVSIHHSVPAEAPKKMGKRQWIPLFALGYFVLFAVALVATLVAGNWFGA